MVVELLTTGVTVADAELVHDADETAALELTNPQAAAVEAAGRVTVHGQLVMVKVEACTCQ